MPLRLHVLTHDARRAFSRELKTGTSLSDLEPGSGDARDIGNQPITTMKRLPRRMFEGYVAD